MDIHRALFNYIIVLLGSITSYIYSTSPPIGNCAVVKTKQNTTHKRRTENERGNCVYPNRRDRNPAGPGLN